MLTNGFLFKSLFENMQNGCGHCICKYDENGKLIDYFHELANQAYINIVGIDPRQKWVSEIFPNLRDESPEVFKVFERVSHQGKSETFETYNQQTQAWYKLSVFCLDEGTVTVVFSDITDHKVENKTILEMSRKIESAYEETINGFIWALRMRDHSSEDHSRRVVEMTGRLARRLGVPEDEVKQMERGALLHDIGKLLIRDNILQKTDALSEEEKESMRRHTVLAHRLLQPIAFISPIAHDIPHHHHERWDGKGYPDGLKGTDIMLGSRIFAVVDNWDALTSDRPYRQAWSDSFTLQYIQNEAGELFDPTVVKEFVKMMDGR